MTQPHQPDDELRALLRAADPASGLVGLEADRITRMVNLTTSQPAPSPAATKSRRPLVFGLAGASGLAAAAFVAVSALTPAAATALRLELGSDPGLAAGSCPAVTADLLADSDLAFAARVETVTDALVTLEVTEPFKGAPGRTVEVAGHELADGDNSGFGFEPGGSYLITVVDAAAGGGSQAAPPQIALCGLSGPDSPELRAVYEAAFR